jgi:hypothetical protein
MIHHGETKKENLFIVQSKSLRWLGSRIEHDNRIILINGQGGAKEKLLTMSTDKDTLNLLRLTTRSYVRLHMQ